MVALEADPTLAEHGLYWKEVYNCPSLLTSKSKISSHVYIDSQSFDLQHGSEGTAAVAGLVALLLNARVVLYVLTRLSGNGVDCCRPPVQLLRAIYSVSSLCFAMLKPQPWEQRLGSMLSWLWTGFLALLSTALSFGSFIVFTGLALYTERVLSWYLDGAPDALLEGYFGCCGNIRDHCIN